MRSVLDYVIRILKEGKGDREMIDSLKSLKTTVGNIMGVAGGFAAAWATVNKVVDASIDTYVTLTDKVKVFHQMTGMTTEDSSRLVEVFDDMGISQEKVTAAFKFAEKNGFQPTIQSILELHKQYQALGDGQERVAFLQKEFGKSGVELQSFFELGDVAERLQDVEMGKIVTEEDITDVKEYKEAVDTLNDSWEAFKANMGRVIVPGLTAALDDYNQNHDKWFSSVSARDRQLLQAATRLNRGLKVDIKDFPDLPSYFRELITPVDSATQSYMAMAEAAGAAAESSQALADATSGVQPIISTTDDFKSVLDFSGKYMELVDQIAIKEAEIANARSQKYSETSEKMRGLKADLSGLQEQEEQFMDQFLLQMLMMAGVPADNLMIIAESMGLINQKTVEAYTSAKTLSDNIAKIPANQTKTFEFFLKLTGDVNKAFALLAATNKGAPQWWQYEQASQKAEGGPLTHVSKVGERGYEYIINGMVIPHEASVWLERAGIGAQGFANGGALTGQQLAAQWLSGSRTTIKQKEPQITAGIWSGGTLARPDYTVPAGVLVNPTAVAVETAQTIAPVAATLQQATAATINMAGQTQQAILDSAASQAQASAEIVAAVNDLPNKIANLLTDSVREVLQYNG